MDDWAVPFPMLGSTPMFAKFGYDVLKFTLYNDFKTYKTKLRRAQNIQGRARIWPELSSGKWIAQTSQKSMCVLHPLKRSKKLSLHSVAVILADPAFVSLNNLKISDIVKTYKELLKANYSEYTVLSVEFSTSLDVKITKGT